MRSEFLQLSILINIVFEIVTLFLCFKNAAGKMMVKL